MSPIRELKITSGSLRAMPAEGSFEIELGLLPEQSPTPRQRENFGWDMETHERSNLRTRLLFMDG